MEHLVFTAKERLAEMKNNHEKKSLDKNEKQIHTVERYQVFLLTVFAGYVSHAKKRVKSA